MPGQIQEVPGPPPIQSTHMDYSWVIPLMFSGGVIPFYEPRCMVSDTSGDCTKPGLTPLTTPGLLIQQHVYMWLKVYVCFCVSEPLWLHRILGSNLKVLLCCQKVIKAGNKRQSVKDNVERRLYQIRRSHIPVSSLKSLYAVHVQNILLQSPIPCVSTAGITSQRCHCCVRVHYSTDDGSLPVLAHISNT